jgi:hypothetical protein
MALVSLALVATVLGAGILGGATAILLAVVLSDARVARRALLAVPATLLLASGIGDRHATELVFAHLHNFVAVAWLIGCFAQRRHRLLLGLGFALAVATLLAFPLHWVVAPHAVGGMDVGYHSRVLAPFSAPELGVRLVLVFAFAQAFHYSVWVRLMPELSRERRAPRTFQASYRALSAEFGPWLVFGIVLSMVALALSAVFALRAARETYLEFALFHGYLELAFIAVFWLEARRPSATPAARSAA